MELQKKIDSIVNSVVSQKQIRGFQKAHIVCTAILELEKLLDDNYMKNIMALQGTSLGFKTDKDLVRASTGGYTKGNGYPIDVVRRCLIEAVLKGLQPNNNEFNIIGGNMYPAKNGLERIANEFDGLKYSIISEIKAMNVETKSALVNSTIKTKINGVEEVTILPIPMKIDAYTSVDAIIGKAKRKALAFMLSNISGEIFVDGDAQDITPIEIKNGVKEELEAISDDDLEDLLLEYEFPRVANQYALTEKQKAKYGK